MVALVGRSPIGEPRVSDNRVMLERVARRLIADGFSGCRVRRVAGGVVVSSGDVGRFVSALGTLEAALGRLRVAFDVIEGVKNAGR